MAEKTVFIGIANQKGGVGKTTVCVHAAAWLARQRYRVCVVDADPQANLTSWLLSEIPDDNGLVKLLVSEEPPIKAWRGVKGQWGVALISGNWKTGKAFQFVCGADSPFDAVRKMVRKLEGVVDFCLVDMPPSRSVGFLELLFALDQVIVPTDLARFGLEGISLMSQALAQMREQHGHAPVLLGVVPNKFRANTRVQPARLRQLVESLGPVVWPPVPLGVAVQMTSDVGTTLFDAYPREQVTAAMTAICERIKENSR